MFLCFAGLPASGKSYLVDRLKNRYPDKVCLLNKDAVRFALFGSNFTDYNSDQDDFVIEKMMEAATYVAKAHPEAIIVFDGILFRKPYRVALAKKTAEQAGEEIRFVLCRASDETSRRRLEKDEGVHVAANRNYQLYLKCKSDAVPLSEPHLLLETDDENKAEERFSILLSYCGLE